MPRLLASRLAAYYGAVFGIGGVLLPFWPTWLDAQGLTRSQIGVQLAAAMIARIVAGPLVARIADRTGARKRLVVLLVALSLASWCLYPLASGAWMFLAIGVMAQGCSSSAMPLVEDMTLGAVRAHALNYGRIRLVGSVTFLIAAQLGGLFLAGRSTDAVLGLMIAGAATTFTVALLLPDLKPTTRLSVDLIGGVRRVLGRPGFAAMFAASGLIQASHMVYYGFGTIAWRQAGLSDGFIGWLWAEGVIAEIALFWYGGALLARVPPAGMMLIGGSAGALRWLGTGLTDDAIALSLLQALHGISFGATHLGAMHYLKDRTAPGLSATAQALYSSVAMGLLGGTTMLAAGPLFAALGSAAFQPMAAMALAGAAIAWRLQRTDGRRPTAAPAVSGP